MREDEFPENVKKGIQGIIEESGFELVELSFSQLGESMVLRLLADKAGGGISIGECRELNRKVSLFIDAKDMAQSRYLLEVSSPGLDRPLKTKNDFLRCLNKKAKFFLNELINGKLEWDGLIKEVGQESVFISVKDILIEVPFLKINKARLIIK